jgi:hypothetical protein
MRLRHSFAPWFVIAIAAEVILATPAAGAPPATQLQNPTVTPLSGTIATLFQLSVQFQSGTTTATSAKASVASKSVPLSLTSGNSGHGTWTGSTTLPSGSWTVTFTAVSANGQNPAPVSAGPVLVTSPTPTPKPSPTTAPTPRPTPSPRATPRPTTVPVTPAPGASGTLGSSQTPYGTTVIDASTSPSASGSGASAAAESALPSSSASPAQSDSPPFNVPPEGVVAIGLLGAVTVAAALGERRRRIAVEAFRAAQPLAGGGPSPGENLHGAAAPDVVDDETVATIDYDAPEDLG